MAEDEYDWAGDRPPETPLAETVIYEAHLRGFTAHPNAGVVHPGTYRGFAEKIPYLRDLGVTAVEFMPLQEFNEMEFFLQNGPRRDLRNFWGYSTQSFFAPMARYAADPSAGGGLQNVDYLILQMLNRVIPVCRSPAWTTCCSRSSP